MTRAIEDMQTVSMQLPAGTELLADPAYADDELPGALQTGPFILVPERLILSVLHELGAAPIGIGCYGVQDAGRYFELRSLDMWTPQLRAIWPGVQQAVFGRTECLLAVLDRMGLTVRPTHNKVLDPFEERLAQMTLV
jgi:hypothetical protein